MNLGPRTAMGKTDPQNPLFAGGWTVAFPPADLGIRVPFEVYHAALAGPAASNFQVFLDGTFYSYAPRGDINEWDPTQAMHVSPGQTINFYWNVNTGTAPKVTIFCREAPIL